MPTGVVLDKCAHIVLCIRSFSVHSAINVHSTSVLMLINIKKQANTSKSTHWESSCVCFMLFGAAQVIHPHTVSACTNHGNPGNACS